MISLSVAAPNPGLKAPQERAYWEVMDHLNNGYNIVLQSPTGSGKTRLASEILRQAEPQNGGIFYVNRKSLVPQTREAFEKAGLDFGVRAADHEEAFEPGCPTQIASADTERIRVFGDKAVWNQHKCGLVIVDEAHIQKGNTMKNIIEDHQRRDAQIILMSATPIALHGMVDNAKLVVAGTLREFRACGLLVPAICKTIEQPDMKKVKRSLTGEFVLNGRKKKIYTQSIVGSVLDRWRLYNPEARPTMLYAPGKAESVWFTEQFRSRGIPWCHVDATEAYWDGKRRTLSRGLWQEILGKYRDGTFKGISSRFKCLDLETEVLTNAGWVRHDEFDLTMKVATMDMGGSVRWELADKVFRGSSDKFYKLHSEKGVDILVTDDHDLVVRSADKKCVTWTKEPACDSAARRGSFQIPVAAMEDVPDMDLTDDEISVVGWMMTDGHIRDYGGWSITQSLAQPAYIHEHIRSSLKGALLQWTEAEYIGTFEGKEFPFRRYAISKAEVFNSRFGEFVDKDFDTRLLSMSRRQLKVLLHAINLADGSKRKNPSWEPKTLEISKGNLTFLSRLQALCVTRGMRANIHHNHNCPRIYITPDRSHANVRGVTPCKTGGFNRLRIELVRQVKPTWCLQVPTGTLITRRNGKVAVVGNCREGIDLPQTYHVILATPIGSLSSYLQTVGRALRAAPGKDHCLITDHGGNHLRHGSPNWERDWDLLWRMSNGIASNLYENAIRNGDAKEPIRCPECETERMSGIKCPECGHEHAKSRRMVLMEDGKFVVKDGNLIPLKRTKMRGNTQRLWDNLYYAFYHKKLTRTFAQMEAFFCKENHYWPPRNLKNMPRTAAGWHEYVCQLPLEDLIK